MKVPDGIGYDMHIRHILKESHWWLLEVSNTHAIINANGAFISLLGLKTETCCV